VPATLTRRTNLPLPHRRLLVHTNSSSAHYLPDLSCPSAPPNHG